MLFRSGDPTDWSLMAQAGAAGPAGAQGQSGAMGPVGPQGPQGQTGATGVQGSIGLTGAQGPAGMNGANGSNGTNGTNGTSFTFRGTFVLNNPGGYNPNDVVADANGSSYISLTSNSGPSDPSGDPTDWSLMAQAGAAGAAGPAGATGSQGPAGPAGPAGATGATGAMGATGSQGPQGPAGPTTAAAVCSALYPNLPTAYCAAAPNTPKFVFVTANTFTGNLGGVAGGNAKCQTEAAAAGLPGTYNAWLSDSLGNYPAATDQFTQSPQPYVKPNPSMTVVANSWTQLVSGALENDPDTTATGVGLPEGTPVWTATTNLGTSFLAQHGVVPNCTNWTDSSSTDAGGDGWIDYPGSWTKSPGVGGGTLGCSGTAQIYCFQQ